MERLESLDSAKKGPMFGLMMYSLSMIILPLASFFLTKFVVSEVFGVDSANLYAVVVSVIAVHCILLAFCWKAYKEDKAVSEKSAEKVD